MTMLALLAISFASIVSSKKTIKTATATPDESSDDLSIALSGDYVAVEDVAIDGSTTSAWKIWTPQRENNGYGEYDVNYDTESDEYKASQTGMNMDIKVSKTYSFDKNQKSSIIITINGKLETEDEGDMILAFSNISATEYFASMIRLDNNNNANQMMVYPACSTDTTQSVFAEGNVAEVADGSKSRIYAVVCPKQYPNGEHICHEVHESITNGFPVTVTITNFPRSGKTQYIYTSVSGESVDCLYDTSFEVNNGFQFYIAGEGVNGPSEIFYISEISVAKEYCNNRPEWKSTYSNTGRLSLEDPCYDGTNFEFQMETLTKYTSHSDTTGTVTDFTNSGGSWSNWGEYSENSQYEGISARINKYTNDVFECEMVIFMAEGTVNEKSVVVGTTKYSINIDNGFSDTAADDATLKVCVDIIANDKEEEQTDEWEDASLYTLANGAFKLQNEKTATCTTTDGGDTNINVIAERDGGVLCYTFSKCDGKIKYDPFVYYEGEEEESYAVRYGGFGLIGCVIIAIYALF